MKPGRYLMTPTFLSSEERTRVLTREVEVIRVDEDIWDHGVQKPHILTREVSDGPPNGFLDAPLWEEGQTKLREVGKWSFEAVE